MIPSPRRIPEPLQNLSDEQRWQIRRRALSRPMGLLTLIVGGGLFAVTLGWWILPLTIVTYLLLVFLATRDPVFQHRALGMELEPAKDTGKTGQRPRREDDLSPERRARWLPRGQTRRRVESALEAYRKSVTAIEGANDTTRAVLEDAVPRLHTTADHLVDVAANREKLAESIREIEEQDDDSTPELEESRQRSLRRLRRELEKADDQIQDTTSDLLSLRLKVAEVSLSESTEARTAAEEIKTSLDQMNAQLDALNEVNAPEDGSNGDPGHEPEGLPPR